MSAPIQRPASNTNAAKRNRETDPHTWPDVARSEAVVKAEVRAKVLALPTTRTKAWLGGWDSVSLGDVLDILDADRLATDTATPEDAPFRFCKVRDGMCSRHATNNPDCMFFAAPVAVEGVETVEYRIANMPIIAWFDKAESAPTTDRREADGWLAACGAGSPRMESRTVCVSEWSPVEPETSEPEGGESRG